MRYGLPYLGSKNAIADWIVSELPSAETFVDLFFGGGAITHKALLSHKYQKFIINDIDDRLPKLFLDCVHGKYTVDTHPEWITREEFNRRKDTDAYIALIWSFGNNGKDYLYGKDIEEMKHANHKAVYDNNMDDIKKYGYTLERSYKADIYERYLDYQQQIKKQAPKAQLECLTRQIEVERLQSLQSLQRLQSLQSLQSLQRLQSLQSLQNFGVDYQQVPIPNGALIYCDIPYSNTKCGKYGGFNHNRFYAWAQEQDNIFISEYSMPNGFIEVANAEKSILSTPNGDGGKAIEKIFTNKRTYDSLSDDFKERIMFNTAEQCTFSI